MPRIEGLGTLIIEEFWKTPAKFTPPMMFVAIRLKLDSLPEGIAELSRGTVLFRPGGRIQPRPRLFDHWIEGQREIAVDHSNRLQLLVSPSLARALLLLARAQDTDVWIDAVEDGVMLNWFCRTTIASSDEFLDQVVQQNMAQWLEAAA